jgi:sugar O-acyltransferase (sialic acid O-acetyltransferase NeuD family)
MNNAVIVGSGGHARVIISLLRDCGQVPVAILDVKEPEAGELIMGVPVFSAKTSLLEFSVNKQIDFYIAMGDNDARLSWWKKLTSQGLSCPNLVSPSAKIDIAVSLGSGNVICANVFIGPEVIVGSNNIINTGAIIEHEVVIGSHSHFAPGSVIAGRVDVSDLCFIGAGSTIIDKIKVSRGVTLGAGGVMVRHADIENGIYIGCPAIFTRSKS